MLPHYIFRGFLRISCYSVIFATEQIVYHFRFYNLDVSTGNNPIRHGQLNTMISLDVRNSYALRRAADAPGSVGQTQRR